MSTTTASTTTRRPVGFGGVLASEWIKLTTLRSTLWCYVIIVVLTVGLGFLFAGINRGTTPTLPDAQQQAAWLQVATLGIGFSQLVAAVLGALVITGEYGTGMIRSTFAAVPTRLPAIFAKTLVFGVATFVVSLVSMVLTALLTAPILPARDIHPDFSDWHVWWAIVGGAGYVALIGILSLAIGTIIRNSAGGIASSLGLVLVVPTIVAIFARVTDTKWVQNLGSFLPSAAGGRMYAYVTDTTTTSSSDLIVLTPVQGFLVLAAWIVVLYVTALVLVKRRDV